MSLFCAIRCVLAAKRDVGSNERVVGYLVEAHCDDIEWYVMLLSLHLCRMMMS